MPETNASSSAGQVGGRSDSDRDVGLGLPSDSDRWFLLGEFRLTVAQSSKIKMPVSHKFRKLCGDWQKILREHVLQYHCILEPDFSGNYCPSDPALAKYYNKSICRCKWPKCREYKFLLLTRPNANEAATIQCYTDKRATNHEGPNFRMAITGVARDALAKDVLEDTAARVHHKMLANRSTSAIEAGDVTGAPTSNALEQMAYEANAQKIHCSDALTDLHQIALDLQGLGKDGCTEHYIRDIVLSPPERFSVSLYSTLQIKTYLKRCIDERGPYLYLDATGGLIKKTPSIPKKEIYYYALVSPGSECSPVAELLTSDHTWPSIEQWLNHFFYEVKNVWQCCPSLQGRNGLRLANAAGCD